MKTLLHGPLDGGSVDATENDIILPIDLRSSTLATLDVADDFVAGVIGRYAHYFDVGTHYEFKAIYDRNKLKLEQSAPEENV